MPSKIASKPPPATNDFNDYLLEGDLSDNPFASPPPGAGDKSNANKRKESGGGGLGIDEEVEVKKRVTVPRVKLDEARYVMPISLLLLLFSICPVPSGSQCLLLSPALYPQRCSYQPNAMTDMP